MKKNPVPLLIVIILCSVLGFVVENLFTLFRDGYINNRGMILPALLGYGIAIAGFYIIMGTPQSPLLLGKATTFKSKWTGYAYYYLVTAVLISIGETVLGTVVEIECHLIWWTYEDLPLHLGRYTSVPTSLAFAAIIFLFMRFIFPAVFEWASSPHSPRMNALIYLIAVFLLFDFIHSAIYMVLNNDVFRMWNRIISVSLPHDDFEI